MYFSNRPILALPALLLVYLLAVVCSFPALSGFFPLSILASAGRLADTLLHEFGHSIFGFLYGMPNLPAIYTLMGTDQDGGMIYMFDRQWLLQIMVFAGLGFVCYFLYSIMSRYYYVAFCLSMLVLLTAFSGYYVHVVEFMGHGTVIALGGLYLYRSFPVTKRSLHMRLLYGYVGLFLLAYNIRLAWLVSIGSNDEYLKHFIGGVTHFDTQQVATGLGISNQSVAACVMMLGFAALIAACAFALYKYAKEKLVLK